jgi:SAM-dependent methyltransferase
VLELACGPGVWTGQLLRWATDVTAVDGSPEMLAVAAARVGSDRVRFIQADLFGWRPDRRYDVVFIGFFLSHVPAERFAPFWSLVADALKPGGRVFFADDAYRTPDELVNGRYLYRPGRDLLLLSAVICCYRLGLGSLLAVISRREAGTQDRVHSWPRPGR